MAGARSSIVFLCTGNSCRSQMAEGWMRALHGAAFEVYSAGTRPKAVDRIAIQVMAESGVDISEQRAKHIDELASIPFDYVVIVCDSAASECPTLAGRVARRAYQFDDPPKLAQSCSPTIALEHYRRVRDEIRAMILNLPKELV